MSIGILFKIATVGILVTILTQILKHSGKEELSYLLGLSSLILVLSWVLPYLLDLFKTMQELFAL